MMDTEVIVQFSLDEHGDEVLFSLYPHYQPSFTVGEKVHLVRSVERGFEERRQDDIPFWGDFEIVKITHSLEIRYSQSARQFHFVMVTVKPVSG